jgi:anhydro-N-acetylmuramic acid kinase
VSAAAKGSLYIGLISGTSADGVDAALVDISGSLRVLATSTFPYPAELREAVLAFGDPAIPGSLDQLGRVDIEVAEAFALATASLLESAGVPHREIRAIGSHGQTVRHRPIAPYPFTLQIGDPNVIAERTGITTVADFRRRDVAAGGQGAPLVPAFHAAVFAQRGEARTVLNLGGIANVTLLASTDASVRGFDTGPANCLLDLVANRWLGLPHDAGGAFAAKGRVLPDRFAAALADSYFHAPPPKSTGREYFDWAWLTRIFDPSRDAPADVLATLVEITAKTIADAIVREQPDTSMVHACGGGVHNRTLMTRLAEQLKPIPVETTATLGIAPDFVEAVAFAWLASRTLQGLPGNLPEVTGARGPRVLGTIFPA